MKSDRIVSIDIIRCIAIIGMVLSANIGFNSGLPAWMFHAQTPPPDYAFDPCSVGLTWVDLVFPFFLLPMGAAFPLAMRRRLERGESRLRIVIGLFRRWLTLVVFALVLGNAYSLPATFRPLWQQMLFRILIWISLSLALLHPVAEKRGGTVKASGKLTASVLNLSGLLLLCSCALIQCLWFAVPLSFSNDVIITILANVALFGGLIWLFTKDNLRIRWLVFLLVAAVKAFVSYVPAAADIIRELLPSIGWLFSLDYLQYLLIALPGSVIGDMIMSHSRGEYRPFATSAFDKQGAEPRSSALSGVGKNETRAKMRFVAASVIVVVAVILQLWGLFTRAVFADFCLTLLCTGFFVLLTHRCRCLWTDVACCGFALMIAGIVFDPIDGGITKDYCNLSYLFTTGGAAVLVTSVLLCLEMHFGIRGRFLAAVGQNPMVAYTVSYFVVAPVLTLTGLLPVIYGLADGSCFWGVMQGVLITMLMMLCTALCTRLKLFWRS